MKIENEQVKKIYDRWDSIWRNEDIQKEVRLKAFSVLKVIEAMVELYECDNELCSEQIDDLFIKWDAGVIMPIFPEDEDRKKFRRMLRKSRRRK